MSPLVSRETSMLPIPVPDSERENRIIQDLVDLMHADPLPADPATWEGLDSVRRARRWIGHVLADIGARRRWWFLDNVATAELSAGQDVIELAGHIDKVTAVFAPRRLHKLSLAALTELRQSAAADNSANAAAECTHYALQAGKLVHLWPAPSAAVAFAVLYSRPIHCAILPSNAWERIVLNGVIGTFGRHFDRDALTSEPVEFERRYEQQLRRETSDGHDIERLAHWSDRRPAGTSLVANSDLHTAVAFLVPASLSGIGYVSIETGDYPLTVA